MTEHKIQCLLHCTALVLSHIPKYKTKLVSHTIVTESCSSRPVQDPGFTPDGVSPNRNFDCSRRWSNTECWYVAARLPSNPYRERRGTISGATLMYTEVPLRTVQPPPLKSEPRVRFRNPMRQTGKSLSWRTINHIHSMGLLRRHHSLHCISSGALTTRC
jgi:hypothetical protein